MASLNASASTPKAVTAGGGPAVKAPNAEAQLRRLVMANLLWEDQFYLNGKSSAAMIEEAAAKVSPEVLSKTAIEARTVHNLRHVPLLLTTALASRGKHLLRSTINQVVQRADELTELVSIYWRNGKRPLAKQMKLGLADAFGKFNAYQLAKYDRAKAVRLRDVMFLTHPKPKDEQQAELWKKLANNTLESPDTWEVALSSGADKKETFERLLSSGKLGYLALLRNLRNMVEAGVDRKLITDAILDRRGADKVLPFRFVAAARACPSMEPALDKALVATIETLPKLTGTTVVLVDVSGSMDHQISSKSDLKRADAAAALASVINAEDLRVLSFSDRVVEVPARRGMAGVQAILTSQRHSGTALAEAVRKINKDVKHDRLIVITDEQSTSWRPVPDPVAKRAYMINVAAYQNGVGYKKWVHIDGFSEQVIRFIHEIEKED